MTVITSDNPRSEDPAAIIAEIEPGARREWGRVHRRAGSPGRDPAGAGEARPGDVVVIAGKGHESGQEFADRTIPFDDREVASRGAGAARAGARDEGDALEDVAEAIGGRLLPGLSRRNGSGARRRQPDRGPGTLFFALAGERTDGHPFVGGALERRGGGRRGPDGAPHSEPVVERSVIEVDDPGRALLELAKAERAPLAGDGRRGHGLLGEDVHQGLGRRPCLARPVRVASPASFNNEVGLPLTILSAPEDAEAIVCEMGARGRGHIRLLCDVARPSVGVVTNVGVAHLELFGSLEAIREAKAELPEPLGGRDGGAQRGRPGGPGVRRTNAGRRSSRSGVSSEAAVRAERIELDARTGGAGSSSSRRPARSRASSWRPRRAHGVERSGGRRHGEAFGLIPLTETAAGLATAWVSRAGWRSSETSAGPDRERRLQRQPTSMAAAFRAARWMAGDGRCIAVLGGMAELWPDPDEEHERMGELLAGSASTTS